MEPADFLRKLAGALVRLNKPEIYGSPMENLKLSGKILPSVGATAVDYSRLLNGLCSILLRDLSMKQSLIIAAMLAVALTACGKKEEAAKPMDAPKVEAPAMAPAADAAKPADAAPAADAAKPADAPPPADAPKDEIKT